MMLKAPLAATLLAALLAISSFSISFAKTVEKTKGDPKLKLRGKDKKKTRAEKKEAKKKIKKLKSSGATPIKRRFRRKKSLASVLFPGVAPEEYGYEEEVGWFSVCYLYGWHWTDF